MAENSFFNKLKKFVREITDDTERIENIVDRISVGDPVAYNKATIQIDSNIQELKDRVKCLNEKATQNNEEFQTFRTNKNSILNDYEFKLRAMQDHAIKYGYVPATRKSSLSDTKIVFPNVEAQGTTEDNIEKDVEEDQPSCVHPKRLSSPPALSAIGAAVLRHQQVPIIVVSPSSADLATTPPRSIPPSTCKRESSRKKLKSITKSREFSKEDDAVKMRLFLGSAKKTTLYGSPKKNMFASKKNMFGSAKKNMFGSAKKNMFGSAKKYTFDLTKCRTPIMTSELHARSNQLVFSSPDLRSSNEYEKTTNLKQGSVSPDHFSLDDTQQSDIQEDEYQEDADILNDENIQKKGEGYLLDEQLPDIDDIELPQLSAFSLQILSNANNNIAEKPENYIPPDDFVLPFSDTPQRFKSNISKAYGNNSKNYKTDSKVYGSNSKSHCVPKTPIISDELKCPRLSTFSSKFLASVNRGGASLDKPNAFVIPADFKLPFNDTPEHHKLSIINENIASGQYESLQKENRSPTFFHTNFAKPKPSQKSKSSVKKKIAYGASDDEVDKSTLYDNCLQQMSSLDDLNHDTTKAGDLDTSVNQHGFDHSFSVAMRDFSHVPASPMPKLK